MKFSFTPLSVKETAVEYDKVVVKDVETVVALCQDMVDLSQEMMVVFDLNVKLKVIDRRLVTLGTLSSSLIHPRELFRGAIINAACGVILVHNHPSGDPWPSGDDDSTTKRMVEAGALLGVQVFDHIIVAKGGYYSYKQSGKIK